MTDAHAADDHATPLTPAERDHLIPTHITGSANLQAAGDARMRYIEALRAADKHDLEPLIRFARS
jgi:hypothetical protein